MKTFYSSFVCVLACFMSLQAGAATVSATIVNAGFDVANEVIAIFGGTGGTYLFGYGNTPLYPGGSTTVTGDDSQAFNPGYIGSVWVVGPNSGPGTSAPYNQGQGGSVTVYIFPGGINTNYYSPPQPYFQFPLTPDYEDLLQNLSPSDPCGMPVWEVSEPFISLWLRDEPLGYQPAVGPRVSFELNYKQREVEVGINPNMFSCGNRWGFSWFSCVAQDDNGSNIVYLPGGGQTTFSGTNDFLTNTRLTGDTNQGFTLQYPDGSSIVYGFVITNSTGAFQEAFMTRELNPQGQAINFIYDTYTRGSAPVIHLKYVVDGDGRTNSITYTSPNLISAVTDPFGRTTHLSYNSSDDLTGISDVAGNSSSFHYDGNDWATNMVTPYGTTTFAITDPSAAAAQGANAANVGNPVRHNSFNNQISFGELAPPPGYVNTYSYGSTTPSIKTEADGRSILITRPDGSRELYAYSDEAPVPTDYSSTPDTTPFTNTLDFGYSPDTNYMLNCRNSFHWGPRQYANLSTTNISSFNSADYLRANMKHWLRGTSDTNLGSTLSLEREPSLDNTGAITGQITWYDYAGKSDTIHEGNQNSPLLVARVLPDGTSWYSYMVRNSWGNITTNISTYSAGLRTNNFVFAPNDVDLLMFTNALGVLVSSNGYNSNHQIAAHFDALGELTSYTYNASQQVVGVTIPSGLVTTNFYGPSNVLAQQIVLGFTTNSFTYTNDLIFSHTDPRGLTTVNTWDNLNRLTSTAFPDGSTISNIYTILDLTASKDRLGNWTLFGYDNLRRNTSITNALGRVTTFDYCTCGALASTLDAATNLTQYFYDNQGNLTNTLYADGYSSTNTYNLLGQVLTVSDSTGTSITNIYNNQGLNIAVLNAAGLVMSNRYDLLDRITNSLNANGVSISTTYDNLDRPLTRTFPDGGIEKFGYTLNVSGLTSHTNQIGNVTQYAYDSRGRKTNEVSVGITTNQFLYDGAGDMLALTDGKGQTTTWHFDTFGRVTNKVDAAGHVASVYQYNADDLLTNRWTPAQGNTGYAYDAVGNRTAVAYPLSTLNFGYDALNRMTNMIDGLGTTHFNYDSAGELLAVGGLWTNDSVNYAYTNRLLSSQTLATWTNQFSYDAVKRMTSLTSPAGPFTYIYDHTRKVAVAGIVLPNSAYITNTYDGSGRLQSTALANSSGHVLDGYTYGYNQLGQRTNIARDFGLMSSTASAQYDAIGQLTSWTAKDASGTNRLNEQLGYAYDAAGNLAQRTNNTLIQTFGVDGLNELTNISRTGTLTASGNTPVPASSVSVNGQPAIRYADFTFASSNGLALLNGANNFTNIAKNYYGTVSVTNSFTANLPTNIVLQFDANGNLTNDGTRAFYYDSENQLTNVTVAGLWRRDYLYDGLNRRRITRDFIWQSSAWAITNETRFIYDGNLVVQEWNSNNVPQVTYVRGMAGLQARVDASGPVYYHADGNGNVTALLNTNQYIVARYLYDPFGKLLGKWGALADANTCRFAGKEFDVKAGFYYFGRRFYEPNLQRFINRDPMAERGGLNLYGYCGNNPVNLLDILGLSCPHWWQNIWNDLFESSDTVLPEPNYPYYQMLEPNAAGMTPEQMQADGLQFSTAMTISAVGGPDPDRLPVTAADSYGFPVVGPLSGVAANLWYGNWTDAGSATLSTIDDSVSLAVALLLRSPISETASPTFVAEGEGSVQIFRAVDQNELPSVRNDGTYGSSPNMSGKYFSLTQEGANNVANAPMNAGQQMTITSTTVPQSVFNQGYLFNDTGLAGSSIHFQQEFLPTLYNSMTPIAIH